MTDQLVPRPPHRPTKLTPETVERLCEGLRLGMWRTLACQRAGITDRALRYWLEQGERDAEDGVDSPAASLLSAVQRAEAECAQRQLERVDAAARQPQHWTAAMTLLERRFGYVAQQQVAHTGTVAHTLQLVDLAAVRPRPDLPPGAGTWNGHTIETTARETPATPADGVPPHPGDTGG